MKKNFVFTLGNRGLLPEEAALIDKYNKTLQQSADRNGRRLKKNSLISVKVVYVRNKPLLRSAPANSDPVEVPLASTRERPKSRS